MTLTRKYWRVATMASSANDVSLALAETVVSVEGAPFVLVGIR